MIFLIFAQNIDCGYTLEPPRQSMFWIKNKKIRYIPVYSVLLYKMGYKGILLMGMFSGGTVRVVLSFFHHVRKNISYRTIYKVMRILRSRHIPLQTFTYTYI